MNDNERDRCGDGAGPVAPDEGGPSRRPWRHSLGFLSFALAFFLMATPLCAQHKDGRRGLSLSVGVGTLLPSQNQANFYSGAPSNENTILRILHSEAYGPGIWSNLTQQDLITSAVGSYDQLQIAEYPDMQYRMAIQLSVGIRYDFDNGLGWLLRFDYAKLNAIGAFLISSNNGTGILSNMDQYVNCPISGSEKRSTIDFGLGYRFQLPDNQELNFQLGPSMTSVTVLSNDIQVGGPTYSILDLWGGHSPSPYTQPYPYINQGGIGFGGFAGLSWDYLLPNHDAIGVAYTLHYQRIPLDGYEGYAPQHLVTLRFDIANFSFLN